MPPKGSYLHLTIVLLISVQDHINFTASY